METDKTKIELPKWHPDILNGVECWLCGNIFSNPFGQYAGKTVIEFIDENTFQPHPICSACAKRKDLDEMIDRKTITRTLSNLTIKLISPNNDPRIYWAREVTFDYSTSHAVRVDFMKFVPVNNSVSGIEKGDFYCYEVKSSVEDFHSKNGHNMIGDYNYYVMPTDVFDTVSNEIPHYVGVYTYDGTGLNCTRKAKRKNRERPVSEMLLMMFRSAARDRR